MRVRRHPPGSAWRQGREQPLDPVAEPLRDGRYHVTLTRQHDGHEWLAVGPSDAQRLGDGVQRLLASLVPR